MRGLKLIAVFVLLIGFTYMGVTFVEANREEVILEIGRYRSGPNALGFVVMTSTLLGLIGGALLGSFEIVSLLVQNQNLRKRLRKFEQSEVLGMPVPDSSNMLPGDSNTESNPKAFSIPENLP